MRLLNTRLDQFKTSLYEISRTLLNSRSSLNVQLQAQAARNDGLERQNMQLRDENRRLRQQVASQESLRKEIEQLKQNSVSLPVDLPPKGHSYGAKMIALLVEVAKVTGFASASKVVKLVFQYLNLKPKLPTGESIRTWARRIGIHVLEDGEQSSRDEYWVVDHSSQVGKETLLAISRLRISDLPPPGETLSRDKLKVIHLLVGKNWTRDRMREVYRELAKKRGRPAGLLTDGAVELYEPVDVWEKDGKNPVKTIRDFKHVAANCLQRLIAKSDSWQKFNKHLNLARCQIQQTELAAFTPPRQKTKARFMNLGPTIKWAAMASWHLSHAHSASRKSITAARMNQKLGWLRSFRNDLDCWAQCEAIMNHSLGFCERHALALGASQQLEESLEETFGPGDELCGIATKMRSEVLNYCRNIESDLDTNERVWTLTDNLESIFGGFKQLERQQSKGGFTSLIGALPLVNTTVTAQLVREALSNISVKKMIHWTDNKLGTTLTSKRQLAYKEARAT